VTAADNAENGGMPLVAFVVNRTLIRDPRRFPQRCQVGVPVVLGNFGRISLTCDNT
jgi:hypothetical protein